MRRIKTGGGWPAVAYTFRKAREAGGLWKFYKAMRSKNACKTCALGMGGQQGGMVNEAGHFPEVCKKSLQAMAADMQGAIQPEFWRRYGPEQLRQLSPRELESLGRLTQPMLYTESLRRYQPIPWDDALDHIAQRLKKLSPDETFWYFSGRSSNEAGFLLQLFARLYGTNNVNNCSYYCHQASGVGLKSVTGSGTATIELDDLDQADQVWVIGGNPASNHPRLMTTLMHLRRRGGDVIVVNPIRETGMINFSVPSDPRSLLFGTKIASHYSQVHAGGDLALLTGLAKRIVELGAHDEAFLQQHTTGWKELETQLANQPWEVIVARSGVPRAEIDRLAERYAAAKRVVFCWTMGITHHEHGVQNVQAIANLALLRGMVGRPGAGLLPIRGHSNVQGMGSVGVTPQLTRTVFERLEDRFDVRLPTQAGRDTMACMEGAADGTLKFGFALGGNLYGSNPDAAFARRAIENLDMMVYLNTTLNTGHAHGLAKETIILPALARDEEPQPTTQESMFNYIRLSDGGPARHEGPRSEVEVIADIAAEVMNGHVPQLEKRTAQTVHDDGVHDEATAAPAADADDGRRTTPVDFHQLRDTSKIRDAIAAIVPGFEAIGGIDQTREEFHIDGRLFHEPRFKTEDQRARLHWHELPELCGAGPAELRLMTIRSEGQFNTVVYEDYDLYRNVPGRDCILVHPDDFKRLGVESGQRVTVRGPAGALANIRVHPFPEIRPGNAAMYYPEANAVVSRAVDPASRTPAFKCVVITLEA